MSQARRKLVASVTDLWRVAETNDLLALERILSTGVDVNACNEHGTTALMRAAYNGRLHMVKALLARGADPNAVRHDDFTPLTLAAFFGYSEIVRVLVQAGAETNRLTRNGTSARMWASARTFAKVAEYLDDIQPIEPAKNLALVNQQPVLPEQPTLADKFVTVEADPDCDDLVESAPLIISPRLDSAIPPPLPSHLSPLKMSVALFVILFLVVVVILALAPRGDGLQKVETPAAAPPVDEPRFASVATRTAAPSELPVEKTPREVKAVDDLKAQRVDDRSARTRKSKFADDSENVRERKISKPAPKNEVAGAPVSTPAQVTKREVPPLSTQLVSSPSKTAVKPKVIQWP